MPLMRPFSSAKPDRFPGVWIAQARRPDPREPDLFVDGQRYAAFMPDGSGGSAQPLEFISEPLLWRDARQRLVDRARQRFAIVGHGEMQRVRWQVDRCEHRERRPCAGGQRRAHDVGIADEEIGLAALYRLQCLLRRGHRGYLRLRELGPRRAFDRRAAVDGDTCR